MRFFAGLRSVPPPLLDCLMQADCEQRMVLVATDGRSRAQAKILAVAHAHAHPRGETAEIALLVRSDLKGIGFGSLLLDRLIRHCRNHGVARLEADVLRQNARMLHLAGKYGFRKRSEEHTSELQSPCNLVCRLLLEKKKTNIDIEHHT